MFPNRDDINVSNDIFGENTRINAFMSNFDLATSFIGPSNNNIMYYYHGNHKYWYFNRETNSYPSISLQQLVDDSKFTINELNEAGYPTNYAFFEYLDGSVTKVD